jgi:peptidoglycan/LPS O-acetylase OafA/YrhL
MNSSSRPGVAEPAVPDPPLVTVPARTPNASVGVKVRPSFYRPELDIVRFFAFLAVFAYHTLYFRAGPAPGSHIPAWFVAIQAALARGGAFGVDLFFVLSAYLITELLLREKRQDGTLDIKAFYIRRILRIWPIYYLFVVLCAVMPALSPGGFPAEYFVPFLLLVGNWSTTVLGPPFTAALPLWSVSVEEQFYLLWAPVVAALAPRRMAWVAVSLIVVANLSRLGVLELHEYHWTNRLSWTEWASWTVWSNTLTRLDPIAAGILLAIGLRGCVPDFGRVVRVVLIGGGVLCLTLIGHFAAGWGEGLPWTGTLVSYPLAAIAASAIVLGTLGIRVRVPWLQYLGKISYGLYVYHLMCIWIAGYFVKRYSGALHSVLREVLSLALTIVIASVSYALIESKFLELKQRFTHVRSQPV